MFDFDRDKAEEVLEFIRLVMGFRKTLGAVKYLFLLSHMRSRSTLLSHILGSNKQILGYSELNINYIRNRSFVRMRGKLYGEFGERMCQKYLFDKLLHGQEIRAELLSQRQAKLIIMLREPVATIRSIRALVKLGGPDWYDDEIQVRNYYISQMNRLVEYSQIWSGSYYFLDSDSLVADTDLVLSGLSEWLGLNEPLSAQYETFKNTGLPVYGDPSRHILSGQVVNTSTNSEVIVSKGVAEDVCAKYDWAKRIILDNAGSSVGYMDSKSSL